MCIVHAADWLKYTCPNSWTILVQAVGCMKSTCASSWLAENPLVHAADWLKIHLCKQLIGWKSTCASSWLAENPLVQAADWLKNTWWIVRLLEFPQVPKLLQQFSTILIGNLLQQIRGYSLQKSTEIVSAFRFFFKDFFLLKKTDKTISCYH